MASRAELEHAVRASCQIIHQPGVIIIGSQSILATWNEEALPKVALISEEIDVCPLADDDAQSLSDTLEGAIGEMSHFHETHGFYIDGVGSNTAKLPDGFQKRLIAVQNQNTNGYTGYCLDPVDLCVAKLYANRQKDREYLSALFNHRIVDPREVEERLWWTDLSDDERNRAASFLEPHIEQWQSYFWTPLTPEPIGEPDYARYDQDQMAAQKTLDSNVNSTPNEYELPRESSPTEDSRAASGTDTHTPNIYRAYPDIPSMSPVWAEVPPTVSGGPEIC